MKSLIQMVFLALLISAAGQVRAGVLTFSDRTVFNLQGTIDFNSNFLDFGAGFGFPGDPFTRGDVTYQSTNNLTWGSGTQYTTTETLVGNNFWTPIDGVIATGPGYDMFGFDIGTYGNSPISISVSTNLGTYLYPSLTIANSLNGDLEFRGFVATNGEYFTGFLITADNGWGNLPGITNVALGHTGGVVPEPASMAIWGIGALGMGLASRRKKKLTA